MPMSKPQVIITGSIAIDRIMNFSDRYQDLIKPDKIHVLSLSTTLDKMDNTPGGVGANIANAYALLGESSVLLGSVGHDARDYMVSLGAKGIDVTNIHYSDLATASFNVMTDTGGNQVGGFYAGAMSDFANLTVQPWAGQEAIVVVSAQDPGAMKKLVQECVDNKMRMIYDPGQQVVSSHAEDLASGVDAAEVVLLNDYETSMLADKLSCTMDQLKARIPVLITTLGKNGSIIEGCTVKNPITIPIGVPDQVVDPTGAGDAYRAGFLYGYVRAWSLEKCGRLGSVVASFIVEQHGTQAEFTKDQVMARYQKTFNEKVAL